MEKRDNSSIYKTTSEDPNKIIDEENGKEIVEDWCDIVEKIKEIHKLKTASGTKYLKTYAMRLYKEFYYLKIEKDYSHLSCNWIFYYPFCSYIKELDLGDPFAEYGKFLKELLRGLLCKYGNVIDKVLPCLNIYKDKILQYLDLNENNNLRIYAVFKQTYARGLCGDSFEYIKLDYVKWEKIKDVKDRNEKDKFFTINVDFTIVKDKYLDYNIRNQRVTRGIDLSKCANIALLLYLADERKVFEVGSTIELGLKDFNNIVKQAVDKYSNDLRITFRSIRSSYIYQTFLENLALYGKIKEETITTMVDYVGLQESYECNSVESIMKASIKEIRNENTKFAIDYTPNTLKINDNDLKNLIYNNNFKTIKTIKKKKQQFKRRNIFELSLFAILKLYYLYLNDKMKEYLKERAGTKTLIRVTQRKNVPKLITENDYKNINNNNNNEIENEEINDEEEKEEEEEEGNNLKNYEKKIISRLAVNDEYDSDEYSDENSERNRYLYEYNKLKNYHKNKYQKLKHKHYLQNKLLKLYEKQINDLKIQYNQQYSSEEDDNSEEEMNKDLLELDNVSQEEKEEKEEKEEENNLNDKNRLTIENINNDNYIFDKEEKEELKNILEIINSINTFIEKNIEIIYIDSD
ncbi:hypothetical protein ABK040_003367 [Willaertia magna]